MSGARLNACKAELGAFWSDEVAFCWRSVGQTRPAVGRNLFHASPFPSPPQLHPSWTPNQHHHGRTPLAWSSYSVPDIHSQWVRRRLQNADVQRGRFSHQPPSWDIIRSCAVPKVRHPFLFPTTQMQDLDAGRLGPSSVTAATLVLCSVQEEPTLRQSIVRVLAGTSYCAITLWLD